jgi:hypothetical protein
MLLLLVLVLLEILTHALEYTVCGSGGSGRLGVGSGGENTKIPRFHCKVLAAVRDSSGLAARTVLFWCGV